MEEEYKEFQDMMTKRGGNAFNVNFAPVNTNMQNFVNINTEVDTDVNVNSGGNGKEGKPESGHGKPGKPTGEHEYPEHEKPQFGQMKEHLMKFLKQKMEEAEPFLPVIQKIIEA